MIQMVGDEKLDKFLSDHNIIVDTLDNGLTLSSNLNDDQVFLSLEQSPVVVREQPRPICVMVAGVPRSGTSCLAGVLHRLGVRMGPFINTDSEANRMGYHEHLGLVTFHSNWTGQNVREEWDPANITRLVKMDEETREAYQDVIKESEEWVGPGSLWGFKDLRIYHFINEFVKLTRSELMVVDVIRNTEATIASIANYPGFKGDPKKTFEAWHMMKQIALNVLTNYGAPRLVIAYEALLSNPGRQVQYIANFLGVKMNEAAIEFIDPTLNRH